MIKDNLKEFAFKNRQSLAFDSFFGEFISFGYCPGKERKSKNILVSFRYNKLKIMASSCSPFSVWSQIVPPFPISRKP